MELGAEVAFLHHLKKIVINIKTKCNFKKNICPQTTIKMTQRSNKTVILQSVVRNREAMRPPKNVYLSRQRIALKM
jgi:hypothetical protein